MKKNVSRRSQLNTKKINGKAARVGKKLQKDASKAAVAVKDGAVERSQDMAVSVDKAVRKSPWYFIGGAAATSAIAGAMMGMRAKKSNIKARMKRH